MGDAQLLAAKEGLRETTARIAQWKLGARRATTRDEQSAIWNELREVERKQRRQRQDYSRWRAKSSKAAMS